MFGRRRRIAAAQVAPAPELNDEQVLDILHGKIAELVGVSGLWTLVPRRTDDTDVIFHELKADQIASELCTALRDAKAAHRPDEPNLQPPATGRLAKRRAMLSVTDAEIEPTALSWTPAPISVWADPKRATVTGPVEIVESPAPRLVA